MRCNFLFLVLLAGGCAGLPKSQQSAPAPASASKPDTRLQVALPDYDRTIQLLETGIRQHWNQEHFRKAFAAAYGPGILSGNHLTACGFPVEMLLRPRGIWDERMPFDIEVQRTLEQCRGQRALAKQVLSLQR
jgi:hypothetical protein